MADDRAQARREAASLLGVDIEHLSAADGLRVDMVSALRLVIDSEQAGILSGGSADLGKLNVAVQSLIALLPNRELPESAASRADPRAHMWAVYSEMRRRGADVGQGYDGALKRIAALEAEIAALKAGVSPAPDEPSAPSNVVTLSRPPTERTTERSVVSPSPPAAPPKPAPPAPAADMVDLRAGYNDAVEPWREHLNRHYDRWADNRE
jgi:hypothetical protein